MEEKKYTVEDFKLTYIPKMMVSLSDDEMEFMSKIVQKLEELPEVVEVYDNVQWNFITVSTVVEIVNHVTVVRKHLICTVLSMK